MLGVVHHTEGRLSEARERIECCLVISRENGLRGIAAAATGALGQVLHDVGDLAASEELLLASLAESEKIGERDLSAHSHLALGSLRAATGDEDGARESLVKARDLARDMGVPRGETLARCELAVLSGGDLADALEAYGVHAEQLNAEDRRQALYLLWRATGDSAYLERAKRQLDEWVAYVDDETRRSMLANVRVNREIMAAWGAKRDGDGDGDGAESATRIG
jgi:tetratricopeptide (TPR) repeat protein